MAVNIAVLKEIRPFERRVAVTPTVASKYAKLGVKLTVQAGAAEQIGLTATAYDNVGFSNDGVSMVASADIVLSVQPPDPDTIRAMKPGSILVSFIYEAREPTVVQLLLERKITCFAMERIPRISRAQSMDALSSQAALAGYYSVQLGATQLARILPKVSTAAGVVGPAKVLVLGLGVAGLQAIATAKRLGAVVEGYDVRPETKEQAFSLGAKFVDTGIDAHGEGGYARALTDAEKAHVDSVLTEHIQGSDLVITTAAIPGRPSPKLVSHSQVAGMKQGAVIVDLSAEGGGNCEDTRPGETVKIGGVTIVAPINVPSLIAEDASKLYSQNIFNFLALILKDEEIKIDWDDEVVAKTALTHDGVLKSTPPPPPVPKPTEPPHVLKPDETTISKGY